ncbi:hypothetical protein [Hymenobacter tenuis]
MCDNPKFGPNAQTPEQRAYVLQQIKAANPQLVRNATPYAHWLYGRYIAGELSWDEVCQLRDAPQVVPGIHCPI